MPPQQGATGCHRVTHASNSVQYSPVQLSPTQPRSVDALPQTLWQIKFVSGTTKDVERESEGRTEKVRGGIARSTESGRGKKMKKGREGQLKATKCQCSLRLLLITL